MIRVAVAGGSSGIGQAIVEGLRAHGGYKVILLSRNSGTAAKQATAVDYTKIENIKAVLEDNDINTVISALPINDDASGIAQLNLIQAASQSGCTQRFLPSEFGMIYREEYVES